MTLKSKFNSADNPKWKAIADWMLYLVLPMIQTFIAGAVLEGIITGKQAFWSGFIITAVIGNIKFFSKFTSEKKIEVNNFEGCANL